MADIRWRTLPITFTPNCQPWNQTVVLDVNIFGVKPSIDHRDVRADLFSNFLREFLSLYHIPVMD